MTLYYFIFEVFWNLSFLKLIQKLAYLSCHLQPKKLARFLDLGENLMMNVHLGNNPLNLDVKSEYFIILINQNLVDDLRGLVSVLFLQFYPNLLSF